PHTFLLAAPAECIDGVDNDRDGLVDAQEGGCRLDPGRPESDNVGAVQVRAVVTVWDDAPGLTCGELDIPTLAARTCLFDGGRVGECTPAVSGLRCSAGEPVFFDVALGGGHTYVIELEGVSPSGETRTLPARSEPFVVDDAGTGASVFFETDFGADDFLEPVVGSTSVTLSFPASGEEVPCEDKSRIQRFGIELLDAHGGASVAGDASATYDGEPEFPLDGTPAPCKPQPLFIDGLEWGGYTVRVRALADDDTVCFVNETPLRIFPGENPLEIPAVLDDGELPASCTTL
ncbi:MAG: hypothetical protein IAG13_08500, partial [Deltaproteobacteria bacterium]|nr:hypothetical protein [Nannocystaceae bacterium]